MRSKYEPRLGSSLASVRVHRDSAAQASARSVDAAAYTVGNHVVLGGKVSEHTLAHELAHVTQQPKLTPGAAIPLGRIDSPSELAADRTAARMLGGLRATPASRVPLHLARKPAGQQEETDDDGPPQAFTVYIDRPLDQEEMFRELLRQEFGVTDRAKQDELIGEFVATPAAPAITARKLAKNGPYQKIVLSGNAVTGLAYELGKIGLRFGAREDSADLEKAIADLHRYIPGGFVDAKKADLEAYRRIAKKLATLLPQELADFQRIAILTTDLKSFEASVDAFIAAGDKKIPPDLAAPSDHTLDAKRGDLTALLGPGIGAIRVSDGAQLDRLIALARKLTPDQRDVLKGGIGISNGDALEAALTAVTAPGAKGTDAKAAGKDSKDAGPAGNKGSGGAGDSKATDGPPGVGTSDRDQLKADLAGTWKGITQDKWSGLDRSGRLTLARDIAARQRNLQLKYTATHPGELAKGMVTAPFKIQEAGDEFWKGMGEVVHGHSTWQRIAGFLGGTKATTGWLAAVMTALAIIAFIINPESALIRLLISRAIALMVATAALTMLEAEMRVQQAASAPNFDEFMTGTEEAGAAQAQFYAQMAMMVLPLAGEILSKVPIVGRVMPVLRNAQKLGGKGILGARARIITALTDITKWATKSTADEATTVTSLAAQIRGMKPDSFAKALSSDSALRDRLGFDAKSGPLIEQLASSPEGQRVLGELQTEAARVVDDSAQLAHDQVNDYTTSVDVVIAKLEGATTEAQAQKIIDDAVADLGETATGRDFQQRGNDYVNARSDEATAKARADADAAQQAEADRRGVQDPTKEPAKEPTDVPVNDEPGPDEQPAPTTNPDAPKPWEEGDNPRRYENYKYNLARRNAKRPANKQRPTLSEKDWWEKYGRKEGNNPYGGDGDPDHQAKVRELVVKARNDYPNQARYQIRSNQKVPGLNQKPDAAVIDVQTNKVVKIYEAARFNESGKLIRPDEGDKIADYQKAGVPYEFHPVGESKPPGGVLSWEPPPPTKPP